MYLLQFWFRNEQIEFIKNKKKETKTEIYKIRKKYPRINKQYKQIFCRLSFLKF